MKRVYRFLAVVIYAVIVLLASTLLLLCSVFLCRLTSLFESEFLVCVFAVPPPYPIILRADGFNPFNVKSIVVTPTSSNTDSTVNVRFYKGPCEHHYEIKELPKISRDIQPLSFNRLPCNYNYGNLPVYVAGEDSHIVYSISASNAPNNSALPCPMELFLFSDYSEYLEFMESTFLPERGYVHRSGCLPVGTKDTAQESTTFFNLTSPDSYFVSISMEENVEALINISVHAVEYNVSGLELVDCALNEYVNQCTINFNSSSKSTIFHWSTPSDMTAVCVWAQSESITTLSISSNLNDGARLVYIAIIIASIVILVLLTAVYVVTIVAYRLIVKRRRYRCLKENKPLLQTINCDDNDKIDYGAQQPEQRKSPSPSITNDPEQKQLPPFS